MLSLDPHHKFSAINTRRLSRGLASGLSLSGSGDIKNSALRCRNKKFADEKSR